MALKFRRYPGHRDESSQSTVQQQINNDEAALLCETETTQGMEKRMGFSTGQCTGPQHFVGETVFS